MLLSIKVHSVSGPNPIKTGVPKLRETFLIKFYKWCNASFSFSDSPCGCHFLWKKGKQHEEQRCNSTALFLIPKALIAVSHPSILQQPRNVTKEHSDFLSSHWIKELQPPSVHLMSPLTAQALDTTTQACMLYSFFNGPSWYASTCSQYSRTTEGLPLTAFSNLQTILNRFYSNSSTLISWREYNTWNIYWAYLHRRL